MFYIGISLVVMGIASLFSNSRMKVVNGKRTRAYNQEAFNRGMIIISIGFAFITFNWILNN